MAQAAKLAKMLRISIEEAEKLYESYWEGVPALKELKERLENYWRNTNKSYIKSIDGRKLYVRKQHALVNLLLQSGGALVVKYTLMGVAERLSKLGLLGDPLSDTVEEAKNKIYQLIIYHRHNCGIKTPLIDWKPKRKYFLMVISSQDL